MEYLIDDSLDDPSHKPGLDMGEDALWRYLKAINPKEADIAAVVASRIFGVEDKGFNRHIVVFLYDPKDPFGIEITRNPKDPTISALTIAGNTVYKTSNPYAYRKFFELWESIRNAESDKTEEDTQKPVRPKNRGSGDWEAIN